MTRFMLIIAILTVSQSLLVIYMGCAVLHCLITIKKVEWAHQQQTNRGISCIYSDCVENGRRLSEQSHKAILKMYEQHRTTLRPWVEPPLPLIRGAVWNVSDIIWVGDSFSFSIGGNGIDSTNLANLTTNTENRARLTTSPNKSVTNEARESNTMLYTPHQIQKAFRNHSILIQGDSTLRRFYGTLYGVLNLKVHTGNAGWKDFPRGFPSQVPSAPFGVPEAYMVRKGLHGQNDIHGFLRANNEMNRPNKNKFITEWSAQSEQSTRSMAIHSPSPIDPRYLDHRTIIDVNKDFNNEPCQRKIPSLYAMHVVDTAFNKTNSTTFTSTPFEYKVCRVHPTGGWIPPLPPRPMPKIHQKSKYDQRQHLHHQVLVPSPFSMHYDYINTNCLGHIFDFLSTEAIHRATVIPLYSLYIVGPGVWETVKKGACHHPFYENVQVAVDALTAGGVNDSSFDKKGSNARVGLQWPEAMYKLQDLTLHKIAQLAERSPTTLFIWRTSGYYDGDPSSSILKEMNERAKRFIQYRNERLETTNATNMLEKRINFLCLDWASAIESRSHRKERLRGDMQAHYGLEARVLQVQMLTNLLYEHGHLN